MCVESERLSGEADLVSEPARKVGVQEPGVSLVVAAYRPGLLQQVVEDSVVWTDDKDPGIELIGRKHVRSSRQDLLGLKIEI